MNYYRLVLSKFLLTVLIYDKITLIYSVKNAFNPTSEVQNIGNANALFENGSFPNGGYSCLHCEKEFT